MPERSHAEGTVCAKASWREERTEEGHCGGVGGQAEAPPCRALEALTRMPRKKGKPLCSKPRVLDLKVASDSPKASDSSQGKTWSGVLIPPSH